MKLSDTCITVYFMLDDILRQNYQCVAVSANPDIKAHLAMLRQIGAITNDVISVVVEQRYFPF